MMRLRWFAAPLAALGMLIAAGSAPAQESAADLEAELQREAAFSPRMDLGGGFVMEGAEAEGATLRIRFTLTGQAAQAIDLILAGQIRAMCDDPYMGDLINRGATLEVVYDLPATGRTETIRASQADCAAAASAGGPPDDPIVASMIEGQGLEATLAMMASQAQPTQIMYDMRLEGAEADGTTFRMTMSMGGILASESMEMDGTIRAFVCTAPDLRTLTRAGATFETVIRVPEPYQDQTIYVTEADCL